MIEQKPGNISGVEPGVLPPQTVIENSSRQLKRFLRLRRVHEEDLNSRGIRMLDNAIVSRICDLNGLGRKELAMQIINSSQAPKR